MSTYTDLWINNGDVVLDNGHNPQYLTDRAVIAQDIVHAIIETGLAVLLTADRGTGVNGDTQTRIKLLVEDDVRVMPGTVRVEQTANGTWWVYADTIEFGSVSAQITTSAEVA
ncbi:DUF2590 family protein [Shewanella sp.]|uniref:DUF2590 family protein n=1 Tax=Shewanella sp. TaxID=50422 RepID=UPI003A97F654